MSVRLAQLTLMLQRPTEPVDGVQRALILCDWKSVSVFICVTKKYIHKQTNNLLYFFLLESNWFHERSRYKITWLWFVDLVQRTCPILVYNNMWKRFVTLLFLFPFQFGNWIFFFWNQKKSKKKNHIHFYFSKFIIELNLLD